MGALVCLAIVTPLGCGGGDEETATTHRDGSGGSAQFEVKGADNSVQRFGSEADPAELEQAAAALHGFLEARAEGDWAAACRHLSQGVKREIDRPGLAGGCPAALADLTAPNASAALREATIADAGALRVEGARGFLLYRGAPDGTTYAIAMSRDGGEWRVSMLIPFELG